MPFIGNQPALSYTSFAKQDFTTSATTSYTLSQPVANENEIALFINFVRQEPTTAYTASGTSLTLTSATSASDDMYAIFLGKAVQTVNPPDGSVGLDKIDSTAKSFLTRNYRNIIINGDMSIAQRSTSVAGITGNGYYTLDRYHLNLDTMGTWTQSQSTDVPTGQGFATSLKMACTTADASPAVADQIKFQIKNEGQNLQYLKQGTSNAESLTLSFWVKSNKTGIYISRLQKGGRQICKSYTINSADTWEKKTITFAGDTTGTIANTNTNQFNLEFFLGAGTNFTSGTLATSWEATTTANQAVGQVNLADSTSNYINITGVQLEAGTTASDFEFLPFDVNLQRCERYFRIHNTANGTCSSTTQMQFAIVFDPEMRASPSISGSGSILLTDFAYANYGFSSGVTYGINEGTNKGGRYNAGNLSGLTTGRDAMMLPTGTNSSPLEFDAEL